MNIIYYLQLIYIISLQYRFLEQIPTLQQWDNDIQTTDIQYNKPFDFQRTQLINSKQSIQTFNHNLVTVQDAMELLKMVKVEKPSEEVARIYSEALSCYLYQIIDKYNNFNKEYPESKDLKPKQKLQIITNQYRWKYPQFDSKKW